MSNGRIIFVTIVALLSIGVILITRANSSYVEVAKYNQFTIYYDEECIEDLKFECFILKTGFFEISVEDAYNDGTISNEELTDILKLVSEWEEIYGEVD